MSVPKLFATSNIFFAQVMVDKGRRSGGTRSSVQVRAGEEDVVIIELMLSASEVAKGAHSGENVVMNCEGAKSKLRERKTPKSPGERERERMVLVKGEPLVHKLAMIAKYVVFPGAMAAALVYSPPEYNKPKKTLHPTQKLVLNYLMHSYFMKPGTRNASSSENPFPVVRRYPYKCGFLKLKNIVYSDLSAKGFGDESI
ncbi:hypothetical protein Cgig2_026692 [Carnegiea gigantea]|uniref:Uncharacterized protein n=1 Tax=Carnegiea gigantea TaxID=171969 RepID=A0A9Q1JLG0_9CARY|nr:hypothetical protein Cgig2_026692 [Carnegiea gigantea]